MIDMANKPSITKVSRVFPQVYAYTCTREKKEISNHFNQPDRAGCSDRTRVPGPGYRRDGTHHARAGRRLLWRGWRFLQPSHNLHLAQGKQAHADRGTGCTG